MRRRQTRPQENSASRLPSLTSGYRARGRPPTKLRTMAEVAEFLGISKRSVQRFAATGKLHVHRFGRAVRVSEADIAIFLAEHQSF